MKKIVLFSIIGLMFFACEPKEPNNIDYNTPEEIGVEINGVMWSPYNVSTTGKFVANVEDYGGLYQWNRKDTANFLLDNDYYESSYLIATSWLPANNPCPTGWRVPTSAEIESLLDETAVTKRTIEGEGGKGTAGRRFTDNTTNNSIFLPAAGLRNPENGITNGTVFNGYYWSKESVYSFDAYYFSIMVAELRYAGKAFGMSVRCVKE